MKKNSNLSAHKKCTCSAIQQCAAHRKPREQLTHSGNDIRQGKAEKKR